MSVVDFAEDPGDSSRQEDPKQHPAAGQHGKEQQEGGGLRIIKIGEDRHQMGGGYGQL